MPVSKIVTPGVPEMPCGACVVTRMAALPLLVIERMSLADWLLEETVRPLRRLRPRLRTLHLS